MTPCCCIAENKWSNTLWSTKSFWTFSRLRQTNRGRWESWKPLWSFQDEKLLKSPTDASVVMWAGDDRVHPRGGRLYGSHAWWGASSHALSVARDSQGTCTQTYTTNHKWTFKVHRFIFWSKIPLDPTFCPSLTSCLLITGRWISWNGQKLTCFVVFLSAFTSSQKAMRIFHAWSTCVLCLLGFRTEKSSSKQWRRTWSSLPLWVSFYIYRRKSCCLMGKWRGFHCFWDLTGVSCSSRCGSHNHIYPHFKLHHGGFKVRKGSCELSVMLLRISDNSSRTADYSLNRTDWFVSARNKRTH